MVDEPWWIRTFSPPVVAELRTSRGASFGGRSRTAPAIHGTSPSRFMPEDKTPKEITLELVDRLDDDVTFEEILYELHVVRKIHSGCQDAEDERVTGHEDVREELSQWLG